jgi:hypothetical protein
VNTLLILQISLKIHVGNIAVSRFEVKINITFIKWTINIEKSITVGYQFIKIKYLIPLLLLN